ncbi:hypothetical protein F5Y09DRAFT_40418 [Xylaria sp. FL1042]|nr:hypothetical protein F5Y09DRAFT_40418 [Xylaria sp. FL1042]
MSTYQTTEEFTCGHKQVAINRAGSASHRGMRSQDSFRDTRTIAEVFPIHRRCLTCTCEHILEASYYDVSIITRSDLRDLHEQVRVLSLCASKVMQRELWVLGEQVRCLDDIDEFRKGVLALAGYTEVIAHFGL